MGDVAKNAGIARNTLYNYVSDKAELFARVAADHLSLSQQLDHIAFNEEEKVSNRLRQMVDLLFDSYAADALAKKIYSVALANLRTNPNLRDFPAVRRLYGTAVAIVRAAQREHVISVEGDPELVVRLISGLLVNALTIVEESPERTDEVRDVLYSFMDNTFSSKQSRHSDAAGSAE
ncbi:hypothetical protein ACU20_01765 [Actinobaculum suis]|nr:hypothetical protein ACU20_01765 [Actinobaculum suis]